HIVRSHEITEDDLKPIYIGSQQNLGVGGPPPLIQPPPAAAEVAAQQPGTPAAPPAGAQPAYGGSTTPGTIRGPSGQPVALPPGSALRVGGGPYTVPISITDATRLSTLTLTLTFDATKLRVRSVNEGTFMRAGGVNVTFTQQVNGNRIDITLARAADATGATG